jgi:peptide/nickel transport system substrate-binding protein
MEGPAPKTRREFLIRASLTFLGGTLLVACSSPRTTTSQPSAQGVASSSETPSAQLAVATATTIGRRIAATPNAAATPRRGGTLRYGTIGDYTSIDAGIISTQLADNVWSVWDRLTQYDLNSQPQPMLAESWEVSSDVTQIRFKLRKGVQFHTGRELTADDVKWSVQRLLDPKLGSPLTGRMEALLEIETPDKYNVVIKASRPWVEVFDLFEQVNIVDPITFQANGVSKPTGTGPFIFADYAQGDHLRLVRNPNYWRSDRPYLDELVVSIRADPQAAVTQLESGALDMVGWGLPISDTVRLQKDPNFQVLVNATTGSAWDWIANCTVSPTDNKLVRQALNCALDRTRMAEAIWHGLAKAQALPWSATSPAFDADKNNSVQFDLDRARSLLARSGLVDVRLDLSWTTATPDFAKLAQIYQADLSKIGIDAALKPLEPPVALTTRNNKSWRGLLFSQNTLGHFRPASQIAGGTYGPNTNFSGFKDDAYNELANNLATETDPVKQRLLYSQLNDYYLDQSWVMILMQSPEHHVARAGVRGMRYDTHLALVLPEIWLE